MFSPTLVPLRSTIQSLPTALPTTTSSQHGPAGRLSIATSQAVRFGAPSSAPGSRRMERRGRRSTRSDTASPLPGSRRAGTSSSCRRTLATATRRSRPAPTHMSSRRPDAATPAGLVSTAYSGARLAATSRRKQSTGSARRSSRCRRGGGHEGGARAPAKSAPVLRARTTRASPRSSRRSRCRSVGSSSGISRRWSHRRVAGTTPNADEIR